MIKPSCVHGGIGAIGNGSRFKSKMKTRETFHFSNYRYGLGRTRGCYTIVARISRNNLNETSAKEFRADLISRRVRVLADCTDSAGKIRRKLQRVNNFLSSLTVDCCCYYYHYYYYSDLSRVCLLTRNVAVAVVGGVTVKYMFRKLG